MDLSYSKHYSDANYGKKLRQLSGKANRPTLDRAAQLYKILKGAATPSWAKLLVMVALGYFIWPLDAVPDILPGIGYGDDLLIMGLVLMKLGQFVCDNNDAKPKQKS